jgi:hypothetical protein
MTRPVRLPNALPASAVISSSRQSSGVLRLKRIAWAFA